jgi:hypothetical protein
MKLMTLELARDIPMLYSNENDGVLMADTMLYVKFFHPMSTWYWYVAEGSTWDGEDANNRPLSNWKQGEDAMLWGPVIGHETEWGYFTLHQLEEVVVHGLGIERDLYWPKRVAREVQEVLV